LAVKVLGADGSDPAGARVMCEPLQETFPSIKLLWGDSHYAGTFIVWLKEHVGWTMQPVRALTVPKRGLLVPEGEQVNWEKLFPSGFRPLPRRWVVERSFGWLTRYRRLVRDYERRLDVSARSLHVVGDIRPDVVVQHGRALVEGCLDVEHRR